jgi:putative DNA-invertase from lambdoid prophage Rac
MYDKDMPLCAIYARVSTELQSCDLQLRELREYAQRRGWKVAGEFIDKGISGTKASRPALDRLMASARLRRFDTVLVWKLDRWGRSVVDSIRSIQELVSLGIRFIAVTQNIDTDESNPMSRFFLHVMSAFAEMEVSLIRERTIAGVRAARANGKTLGRPKRIFARDEVARLRDKQGLSWRAIAKELKIPVMTAVDAYRNCTEIASPEPPLSPAKTKRKRSAA